MTLDEYLSSPGQSEALFAKRVKKSVASVNRIRNGKQMAGPKTAKKIIEESFGAVGWDDIYGKPKIRSR